MCPLPCSRQWQVSQKTEARSPVTMEAGLPRASRSWTRLEGFSVRSSECGVSGLQKPKGRGVCRFKPQGQCSFVMRVPGQSHRPNWATGSWSATLPAPCTATLQLCSLCSCPPPGPRPPRPTLAWAWPTALQQVQACLNPSSGFGLGSSWALPHPEGT